VPAWGLVVQGIWAGALVLPRTVKTDSTGAVTGYGNLYGNLLDYVISAALIFYILTIIGIFLLRRKQPDVERPYRAFGYPIVPALYVVGATVILVVLFAYQTALGIGAIIGTGIFVLTGTVAAQNAGPAVVLSFVLAGVASIFAALCYSEFASLVPMAGSAYTYGYATLGEVFAWIIGWDLILEYALGAVTVSIGWSGYVVSFLHDIGIDVPAQLSAARGTLITLADGTQVAAIF